MEINEAVEFARAIPRSVLVTVRKNGRPQLSNVAHVVEGDGAIAVSITTSRAKYHNLVRTPWAALHVTADDFWSYAVIEADVTLSPVARRVDDGTVDALVEYYRTLRGEHENWHEYRQAMVDEGRLLVRLRPTHAYGIAPRN